VGFCSDEVFPSPKFQLHEEGEPVELSENTTVSGTSPDVGVPVKFAARGGAAAKTAIRICTEASSTDAFTAAVPVTDDEYVVEFAPALVVRSSDPILPGPLTRVKTIGIPSGTYPLPEVSAPAEFQVRFARTAAVPPVSMAGGSAEMPSTSHESIAALATSADESGVFVPHQLFVASTVLPDPMTIWPTVLLYSRL
jgi:hypothetical protein